MSERIIEIVIKGKNATSADFAAARKELRDLEKAAGDTSGTTVRLGEAFSGAAKGVAAVTAVAAAAAAGMVLAIKQIADLGARGADVADVSQQFDVLNRSIGNNAESLTTTLAAAFAGTISDFDTMQAVNKALSQGLKLSEDQFGLTAQASRVLADRVGGDAKSAFDTLTMAMATGQDKQLKSIGLNIDAEAAVASYARSLGKEASALSESQTQAAKKNAILEEMQRVLRESGQAEVDFGDRIEQAKTVMRNFMDQVSVGIASSPVLAAGMDSLGKAFSTAFGPNQTRLVDLVVAGVNKLAMFLVDAGMYAVEFGKIGVQAFGMLGTPIGLVMLGINKLESGFVSMVDTIGKTGSHLPGVIGKSFAELSNVAALMQDGLRAGEATTRTFTDSMRAMASGQGPAMSALNATGNALASVKAAMTAAALTIDQKRDSTAQDTRAANDHGAALRGEGDAAGELDPRIQRLTESFRKQIEARQKLQQTVDAVAATPDAWRLPQATFALEGVTALTNGLVPLRAGFKDTATVAREAAERTQAAWKRTGEAFGDVASILDHLPGKFFEIAGVAARTGQAIANNLAEGDVFGAVVSGITGVATAIGKLFSDRNKEEVKKYNAEIEKVHDSLLKQYGTMEDLEAAANRVGLSFKENWGHQGKEGLEATNRLAKELEQRLKAVDAALGNVGSGFSAVVTGMTKPWTDLGAKAEAAAKTALDAYDKYQEALKGGGGDVEKLRAAYEDAFQVSSRFYDRIAVEAKSGKQQLADLGVQAIASFGASMAAGKSYAETIAALGPSLATLGQAFKVLNNDVDAVGLGIEDAALNHLLLQATVAKGNPELIAAASGLGDSMQGLAQLGVLNVDTFAAMQRTGSAMYARLQGEVNNLGGDSRDALLPMQSYLQEAAAQATLLGIPLDANTQMLINQSKELGIWKDKGKSAQDLLIDGMSTLVGKVDQLLSKMLGFSGALNGLPERKDVEINITTNERVYRSVTDGDDGAEHHAIGTYRKYGIDFPNWGDGTKVIVDNREAIVPYEDRIETAMRWLGGSMQPAAAGIGPINLYVAVDPSSGRARQIGEAERSTIQGWLYGGQLDVPQHIVSRRSR